MKKKGIENPILMYMLTEMSKPEAITYVVESKHHQTNFLRVFPFHKPISIVIKTKRKGGKG